MRIPAAAVLAALAVLAGCAREPPPLPVSAPAGTPAWNVPQGPGPAMTAVNFDHLPGWSQDRASEALPGFRANCVRMLANPSLALGGSLEAGLRGGTGGQWRRACEAAERVTAGDDAAARAFFEANFQPYGLSADGSAKGLFTGYYDPELRGARVPNRQYDVALYRRPPDLRPGGRPYYTRTQIENGALRRKRLELLWIDDPIDAFFLQIQGAGRVVLPSGAVVRVSYDGQNGQPYMPIGRVLVDRGEMTLDQVSMQTIRAWLKANPRQARSVMNQNPSYVFFRELPGIPDDQGPPGAFGVRLAAMRSLAVDKAYVPLGAPVFIDTTDPLDGTKLQRLMLAQDLGGAIRGAVRADIFFGWGPAAEERAGRMRGQGTQYVLLPK